MSQWNIRTNHDGHFLFYGSCKLLKNVLLLKELANCYRLWPKIAKEEKKIKMKKKMYEEEIQIKLTTI